MTEHSETKLLKVLSSAWTGSSGLPQWVTTLSTPHLKREKAPLAIQEVIPPGHSVTWSLIADARELLFTQHINRGLKQIVRNKSSGRRNSSCKGYAQLSACKVINKQKQRHHQCHRGRNLPLSLVGEQPKSHTRAARQHRLPALHLLGKGAGKGVLLEGGEGSASPLTSQTPTKPRVLKGGQQHSLPDTQAQ